MTVILRLNLYALSATILFLRERKIMHTPPETMNLPCQLTKSEKADFAARAARTVREIEALEEAKKASASTFKGQIDDKTAQLRRDSQCIDSGVEYRSVEVRKELDRVGGVVNTIRIDTGEVVTTRPLSPSEKQMALEEVIA